MPPQLDLLVGILELLAFFLVTPELIGQARLERLYVGMSAITRWLREVWFGPDYGPIPINSLVFLLFVMALTGAGLLGYSLPESRWIVLILVVVCSGLPASFVLVFWLLRWLRRRERLGRVLAIVGVALFVTGRLIVISSAVSRMGA